MPPSDPRGPVPMDRNQSAPRVRMWGMQQSVCTFWTTVGKP